MKLSFHFCLFITAAVCGATLLGIALVASIVNGAPVTLPDIALGGGLCALGLLGAIVEVASCHVARIGDIERDVLIIEQVIGDIQDDMNTAKAGTPGFRYKRRDAKEKDHE
jgi:hypothetical protein